MIPFAEHWNVQYNAQSNSGSLTFALRYSFARSAHRILREGSSSKIKTCVSLQRRAIKNLEMYVSLQRRAQKCYEISVSPRFRAVDVLNPARRVLQQNQNARLATAACARKNVWNKSATSAAARGIQNMFWRPTSTKWRKGSKST